jgi:hypothetical protein
MVRVYGPALGPDSELPQPGPLPFEKLFTAPPYEW